MPDRIAFGSFELDLRQRVLLRHGVAVPLGSREVDVLCTLALAHGDLVGKDRLIAQVWPDTIRADSAARRERSARAQPCGQ